MGPSTFHKIYEAPLRPRERRIFGGGYPLNALGRQKRVRPADATKQTRGAI